MSFEHFNRRLIEDFREHGGGVSSGPFLGRDVLLLTTDEGEYERLYGGHADRNPNFYEYRRKTSRIPVIVLERTGPEA